MRDFLTKICTSEGITTEDSALHMIIHRARGSMRDAITMMEKCIYEKTLTTEYVEKALQLVNHEFLAATFAACESGQGQKIQHIIETLAENNTDVRQFCAQMTEWIVANIDTSLEQKKFSTYKEIFDLFTKVFSQSRLVAVPMEILTMALYERITDALSTTQSAPHKITPKAVSE